MYMRVCLFFLFVFTSIFANTFIDVSINDFQAQSKNTEYSAISRLTINRHTKGVKYNYYFHKGISAELNTVNPIGILYYDADVNTTTPDTNTTTTP